MPTNLPPEYFQVEERYKAAQSVDEKIALLQELIGTVPKHKGTDKLRADLRKRLSKLQSASDAGKSHSRHESAYRIDREGAGQVVVIGPPNVGKSALVSALTNSKPEVSPSPFSTWEPTPGMMPVRDIQVQLIDTPPLHRDYFVPELIDLIKRSDLILLVVDVLTDPVQQLEDTIAILEEQHIAARRLQDRYEEPQRYTFLPLLVLANKNDDETSDEYVEIFRELMEGNWPVIPVSAETRRHVDLLEEAIFKQLGIIRIYSKPPGKPPDMQAPFVVKAGTPVEEFAGKVHKDFAEQLTVARVWGSAQHDGQMVGRDHVLEDGDVIELRI